MALGRQCGSRRNWTRLIMKSYALPQTQEVISIVTDDSGNYLIETLVPTGQFLLDSEFAPWNRTDPPTDPAGDRPQFEK